MKGEQFIKLPRDVLESPAFGSLGINAFRVLRFLMIEHMSHGGRENGNLKAPYRQLVAFGIAARHVTAAIIEAERSGLVRCYRQGPRIATVYELTWLPLHDGCLPGNEWRAYKTPKNLHSESDATLHSESDADGLNLHSDGDALSRKLLHSRGNVSRVRTSAQPAPGKANGAAPRRACGNDCSHFGTPRCAGSTRAMSSTLVCYPSPPTRARS